MLKTVIFGGKGGQGIKLSSTLLADFLVKEGYEVSLALFYDGPIRGGSIYSVLTYSDKRIENPLAEKSDFLILLSELQEKFIADEVITDSSLDIESNKKIPFIQNAREIFNSEKSANMIVLGFLLSKLKFSSPNWNMFPAQHEKIIQFGFNLNE